MLFALLLAAPAMAPVAAMADPVRDQVINGALRCDQITDNRAWLDCFYGSAQPMRASLGLSPAPQARLVPAPAPNAPVRKLAPAPQPRQGFWDTFVGKTGPAASNTPMASYDFGRDRTFTVTLADGQIYRQKSLDMARANWRGAPGSYRVTVTRAPDGYMLRVAGETGTVYHVTRVDPQDQ
jgi:hypothetical protein